MAAKKNKEFKTVRKGFKPFGGDTLARLATTVKVDVPAAARNPGTAIARLLGLTPEQKAARRLSNIKREMNMKTMPRRRRRRSRLPMVIVVLLALFGGGTYWLYQQVSLPRLNLTQYLDYNKWLDVVSGKVHPSRQRLAEFFGDVLPAQSRAADLEKPVRLKPQIVSKKSAPNATKVAKHPKAKPAREQARIEKKRKKKHREAAYSNGSRTMLYRPLGE